MPSRPLTSALRRIVASSASEPSAPCRQLGQQVGDCAEFLQRQLLNFELVHAASPPSLRSRASRAPRLARLTSLCRVTAGDRGEEGRPPGRSTDSRTALAPPANTAASGRASCLPVDCSSGRLRRSLQRRKKRWACGGTSEFHDRRLLSMCLTSTIITDRQHHDKLGCCPWKAPPGGTHRAALTARSTSRLRLEAECVRLRVYQCCA